MKTTLQLPDPLTEPFLDKETSALIAKEINQKPEALPTPAAPAKSAKATRFSKLLDAFYFWCLSR